MYESPINVIVQDIEEQMAQQTEQTILEVVRKCGVVVDKDELIEALTYDRGQYSKGYKDGVNDVLGKIKVEIEEHVKINQNLNIDRARALCWCLDVIDKYKEEGEDA